MIKIQVLGRGLIPRGLGLAPRTEPFTADLQTIQLILSTPGLKMNYLHQDGSMRPLTRKNFMDVWNDHIRANKMGARNTTNPKAKTVSAPAAEVAKETPKPTPPEHPKTPEAPKATLPNVDPVTPPVKENAATAPKVDTGEKDTGNSTDSKKNEDQKTTYKPIHRDEKKD